MKSCCNAGREQPRKFKANVEAGIAFPRLLDRVGKPLATHEGHQKSEARWRNDEHLDIGRRPGNHHAFAGGKVNPVQRRSAAMGMPDGSC